MSSSTAHPVGLAEDLDTILHGTATIWEDLRGGNVFLTGGTGFLGAWLLESFCWINAKLNLQATAVVLTRDPAAFAKKAPHLAADSSVRFHLGDVRDFTFPNGVFSHVIHAAAPASGTVNIQHPLEMLDTIIQGTRRTLDFSVHSGAKSFLLVSSGAVYGSQPRDLLRTPETWPGATDPIDSRSAYGEGKRVAELLAVIYATQHGIAAKIARCFSFIGPYLGFGNGFAASDFISAALRGCPVQIAGDGTPVRSYMYCADLAIWLWTILVKGEPSRPYNVGSEEPVSIFRLATEVVQHLGSESPIEVGNHLSYGLAADRYVPSTVRARAELNLHLNYPLTKALKQTGTWARRALMENP